MSDSKTYIVPDNVCAGGGNNDMAMMAMMNGNGGMGGNGMWNNPFMYLVFMMMMRWMNNGEMGGENGANATVQRQIQTLLENMLDNHNSDLIMSGINGNSDAIRLAASNLGCDINVLQSAVSGVSNSIQQLSGLVGFSAERVINAVNLGDCNVILALKDCCCNTQKSIVEMGYQNQLANERLTYLVTNSINTLGTNMERGFCLNAYATQTLTCDLLNIIKDTSTNNTNAIISRLNSMEELALLDKIDSLREKNNQLAIMLNNAQLTATFSLMIGQATAPLGAALGVLLGDINGIKCKLPETVTLPYSCATAVPSNLLYNNMGFGGCGCGNSLWG